MAFSLARPFPFAPVQRPAPPVSKAASWRPPPTARERALGDRTVLGVLAIIASTLCFPLSDLCAQSLMGALPPIEVAWLRYTIFLLATLPLLRRGRLAFRSANPKLQILRGAMSGIATMAALVSFKYLAVPETTAIGFIGPVFVTGLAVVMLKEQVGFRRWAAAFVALGGVMIIVQPGAASFQPMALLPLFGAVASALAVICTRMTKTDDPRTTILYASVVGTTLLTGATALDFVTPTIAQLQVALVVGVFGAIGMWLQVIGYRLAPASILAPFSYFQLIAVSGLAFLMLGSVPRPAVLIGAAIIAGSAFYTAYRERVRGVA